MSKNELIFTLTGNFQYDLGILGLKRVLDFFEVEYSSDKYSITIPDKNKWPFIGYLGYIYGYQYKGVESIKKKFKLNLNVNDFENFIKSKRDYDIKDFFNELEIYLGISEEREKIEIAAYPALSVFNTSHLNVFNPGYKKSALKNKDKMLFYNKYIFKFKVPKESRKSDIDTCDFCNMFTGFPMNRNNFLFAPSAMNERWFEKQNYKTCSICSSLNLFSIYGMINTKEENKYFIYSSNLIDLDNDNKTAANGFEDLIIKYIEDFYTRVKPEVEIKDKTFISISINSQNPEIDFLPFKKEVLRFIIENKKYIEELRENNFIGIAKDPILFCFRDTVKKLLNEERLYNLADFITLCILKQNSGNKNMKGFDKKAIAATYTILKISNKQIGGTMSENVLNDFKEFGDKIRAKLFAGKSSNAAKNKVISFASSIRDAVNESKERFMEVILQLSIYSDVPIPSSLLENINRSDFNYKEAGLSLALSLMSFKDNNNE